MCYALFIMLWTHCCFKFMTILATQTSYSASSHTIFILPLFSPSLHPQFIRKMPPIHLSYKWHKFPMMFPSRIVGCFTDALLFASLSNRTSFSRCFLQGLLVTSLMPSYSPLFATIYFWYQVLSDNGGGITNTFHDRDYNISYGFLWWIAPR